MEEIMKKFYFTIFTLAALSSAAYANNRGEDLRDSDTYFGKYSTQLKDQTTKEVMTVVSPLAIDEIAPGLTSFERMKMISEENDQGRR
jgi:hypothetical protein